MHLSGLNVKMRLKKNVFRLGLTSFFTDMSSEMIFPVLPIFLTTVLGANMAVIGLIEGVAESAATILKLFSGWFSDKFGKKKPLIIAGYSFSAVTKPLLALSTHWGHVLAVRLADRVGKGLRTAPRDALITASVDKSERGGEVRFASGYGYGRRDCWHFDCLFCSATVPRGSF